MSWTTLGNGICPPPPPEGFRWVNAASGLTNQAAIDNSGRLYTWGLTTQGYTGQTPVAIPATPYYAPNSLIVAGQLKRPTQVGIKSDWIRVDVTHDKYMAIDSQGHIYVWGIVESFIASSDHPDFYDWSSTNQRYEPPGWQALVPTRLDTNIWSSFRLGAYHALLQKADKSLWIWGENLYGNTFGTPTYATGAFTDGPVLMTWIPGPVKLYDAEYAVSAIITESDQVWIWGTFSDFYNIPTQIPFTVPGGTSIVEVACSNSGVLIRLSDGTVYGWGNNIAFAPSLGTRNSFLLAPGGHTFKQLDCWDSGAFGLHTNGDAYGWGIGVYLLYRPLPGDNVCTYQTSSDNPELTAAATAGQRQWDYVCKGGWTHLAIDDHGRLFSWGENAYSELGVGLTETELDHACLPVEVSIPLDSTGIEVTTATETGTVSFISIPIPRQLSAHDPCGHWHKGGGDISRKLTEFAANCWEPTIATDGSHVLYVIAGRHRPNELYMLRYDIPTNIWTEVLHVEDVLHSNWDGGAATKSGIHVYHNYAYDVTGEQYNEITSNPRTITYVTYSGGTNIKEWLGTSELHARNKVAVDTGGKIACIIRVGSTWEVQVSSNYGAGWSLLQTLPTAITDASVAINPNDGLVYVAAVNQAADSLLLYVGNINGTGWALRSTTVIMDASHRVYFRIDGTRLHATVESNVGTKFFYSTNNGTSFVAKDLHESIIHFAATDTLLYNLADGPDWRTDDYEAASITWDQITQFETLIERCTLHNSGTTAVYCQAKLRVEGSEGNIVSILLSHNLGERWNEISTPLDYYETFEETLNLNDDPVWHFVPQYAKF